MKYKESDLVRIAQRENNKMRNYLVVNRLQGKHIPVKPDDALSMFRELANLLKDDFKNKTLLVIGFAETATAIGAAVALELGAFYTQTTREDIPGAEYLFFSEEHSHATQQKLVKDGLDQMIDSIDCILFVEDEVTTGKTILNIINKIQSEYQSKTSFAVASILNGMDEEALERYKRRNIGLYYLVKTDHQAYAKTAQQYGTDISLRPGKYYPCLVNAAETADGAGSEMDAADSAGIKMMEEIEVSGWMNARKLVTAKQYEEACTRLWRAVEHRLQGKLAHRVLTLGTEEFMYPALYIANKIAENGIDVKFHATTRSPIMVYGEPWYPLRERYELRSLYEKNRKTFLYDLDSYDMVLIITDAQNAEMEGICSLLHAVSRKNRRIILVKWRESQ